MQFRWMLCPETLELIYEFLWVGKMTKVPLALKLRHKPLMGK
jgi:hypothetical protein